MRSASPLSRCVPALLVGCLTLAVGCAIPGAATTATNNLTTGVTAANGVPAPVNSPILNNPVPIPLPRPKPDSADIDVARPAPVGGTDGEGSSVPTEVPVRLDDGSTVVVPVIPDDTVNELGG